MAIRCSPVRGIRSVVGEEIEEYQQQIQSLEEPLQQAREVTDPELLEIFDHVPLGFSKYYIRAPPGGWGLTFSPSRLARTPLLGWK